MSCSSFANEKMHVSQMNAVVTCGCKDKKPFKFFCENFILSKSKRLLIIVGVMRNKRQIFHYICKLPLAEPAAYVLSSSQCTKTNDNILKIEHMINETQIEEVLKELFDNIEFTQEPAGLYDPLRYMIGIGGKRVRPRLCLTVYSLFKDGFSPEILEPAAALEVFHSFTLIHDDIMDKAPVRRGVPTVCRKWDDNTAILSGDVMSIDSWRRVAKAPAEVLPDVLELFTATAAQVCEGQQYDMDFEREDNVPMEKYMKMIGLKTAVLLACSAKMGAIIGGADAKVCDSLYRFGYDLGLAFQIADDYLDTFGDPKVFGKNIGGDIANNKKTWLLIRALEKSGEMEKSGMLDSSCGKAALVHAMGMNAVTEQEKKAKFAKVKEIYETIGIDEDAKYEIIKLHASAMEHVDKAGLGRVRHEMLNRYADRLIGRTR